MSWLNDWLRANMGREPAAPVAPPPPREPLDEWARMWRATWIGDVVLIVIGLVVGGIWYVSSHRQLDWAVIVVAGDWRAHDGGPTEGFDNARRDVARAFHDIGFNDDYTMQFSVRPERYPGVLASTRRAIGGTLSNLTQLNPQGCILYFSSHGSPYGMVLGNTILSPMELASVVDSTCGSRPTVVIVSACYSGVFVPALEAPNRMVLTAARPDRTSFGCGQNDKYPYFDACILQEIKGAHSFPELADRAKECVEEREQELGANPPSEPQISIGANVADKLPTWN